MRINQIKKQHKKIKPKPIWSMDFLRNEYDGECKDPLYEIVPDGKWFSLLYHGVCEVNSSRTVEEAKQFAYHNLEIYGVR